MQIIGEYFGASFKKVQNETGIRHNLKVNDQSKYFNELKNFEMLIHFIIMQ